MPGLLIFYPCNSAAFEGLGDDGCGLVLSLAEGLAQLLHAVSIHDDGVPAKGLAALLVDVQLVLQRGRVALAQAVDIKNGDEVVQLVEAGKGHGLPHGAFRQLSVSQQAIDSVAGFVEVLAGVGHPARGPEALAQGAGGHVCESLFWDRVPVQVGADLPQVQQLCLGQVASFSPDGIQDGSCVALGEYKAVIVRVPGVLGLVPHGVEEEYGHDLRRAAA